jgi:beta-carotene 3-hydroxylase
MRFFTLVLEAGLIICFIGLGIFAYGLNYFMIHDVLIHQRLNGSKARQQITLLKLYTLKHIKYTTKNLIGKEDGSIRNAFCPF